MARSPSPTCGCRVAHTEARANTRSLPPATGRRGRLVGAYTPPGSAAERDLGLGRAPDLALGPDSGPFGLHGLVFGGRSGGHDRGDRLAHGGTRETRLLHRPRS